MVISKIIYHQTKTLLSLKIAFFRGAQGVIIVYSVTDRTSFESMHHLLV